MSTVKGPSTRLLLTVAHNMVHDRGRLWVQRVPHGASQDWFQ